MKSGQLKVIVKAYADYFPASWKRIGTEFMRQEGDWVQILRFNPSRFADKYVPGISMEFLKMPGDPTGGFLVQQLQHPNGTQRWISAVGLSRPESNDSAAKVFAEMAKQLKPSILTPMKLTEIKSLLAASVNNWLHAYGLCVIACEEGDAVAAE